ncbi:hypothetical protein K470DRAFT_258266 [Piedraia hortae CBS 480.64]|uniref:Uncharacterized protein n=1 Tax=Piedraia hortae CBS 480.64 TaxID=1314780 RepID=A0A6A7BYP8_9PEZI|nr:hypothetical protein K470DRAFT_258266 [Piedraia hortae CBS 480.64]
MTAAPVPPHHFPKETIQVFHLTSLRDPDRSKPGYHLTATARLLYKSYRLTANIATFECPFKQLSYVPGPSLNAFVFSNIHTSSSLHPLIQPHQTPSTHSFPLESLCSHPPQTFNSHPDRGSQTPSWQSFFSILNPKEYCPYIIPYCYNRIAF